MLFCDADIRKAPEAVNCAYPKVRREGCSGQWPAWVNTYWPTRHTTRLTSLKTKAVGLPAFGWSYDGLSRTARQFRRRHNRIIICPSRSAAASSWLHPGCWAREAGCCKRPAAPPQTGPRFEDLKLRRRRRLSSPGRLEDSLAIAGSGPGPF